VLVVRGRAKRGLCNRRALPFPFGLRFGVLFRVRRSCGFGVGCVTRATCSAAFGLIYVEEMQVLIAVSKIGKSVGFFCENQGLLVTDKAQFVVFLFER